MCIHSSTDVYVDIDTDLHICMYIYLLYTDALRHGAPRVNPIHIYVCVYIHV